MLSRPRFIVSLSHSDLKQLFQSNANSRDHCKVDGLNAQKVGYLPDFFFFISMLKINSETNSKY